MITNVKISSIDTKAFITPEEALRLQSVQISYNINIANKTIINGILRTEYQFSIDYLNPSIGYLKFIGTTDYISENIIELKKLSDENKFPIDIANMITNSTIHNIMPIALLLSRTIGLPPASPIPKLDFGMTNGEKIDFGKNNKERVEGLYV